MTGLVANRVGIDFSRTEAIEETHRKMVPDSGKGACIMSIENCLGAIGINEPPEPIGYCSYCVIPGYGLEPAFSLASRPAQRMRQTRSGIQPDAVVSNGAFSAQLAATDGMLRIAPDLHDLSLFLHHQHTAGIVAIPRARASKHLRLTLYSRVRCGHGCLLNLGLRAAFSNPLVWKSAINHGNYRAITVPCGDAPAR